MPTGTFPLSALQLSYWIVEHSLRYHSIEFGGSCERERVKGHERMKKLARLTTLEDRLGIKTSTLRDWFLKRKNLDFVKVGRAVCVTEESIERFIAANTIPARKEP